MDNKGRNALLESMHLISSQMRDVIFLNFFDIFDKHILSMFNDAFSSVDLFCVAIGRVYVTQAGLLLRKLLEEVSIATILVNKPNLLPLYKEHYEFKVKISNLTINEQKTKTIEKFKISPKKANNNFLDYGWIEPNCDENKMIEIAGLQDIIAWKTLYLNKFAHSSITSISTIGDGTFPILNEFVLICSKLFDHLCVVFHNFTGFNFVFNGQDLFHDSFRENYTAFYN